MRNPLACLALCATLPAVAADIAWSTGPSFSGAGGHNAILTNGSLVAAVDFGLPEGTRVVDPGGLNISFTTLDPAFFAGYIYAAGSPGSTDSGWNAVIGDADWHSAGDKIEASFLTGLNSGATYQLQLFASDSRTCCSSRESRFGDGNGNYSAWVVQGGFTSIVGSFVANGSSQAIEFDTSSNAPVLNAYVLRQVADVPEPATAALLLAGLGLLGALVRRR